jgi:hypothetical protein
MSNIDCDIIKIIYHHDVCLSRAEEGVILDLGGVENN